MGAALSSRTPILQLCRSDPVPSDPGMTVCGTSLCTCLHAIASLSQGHAHVAGHIAFQPWPMQAPKIIPHDTARDAHVRRERFAAGMGLSPSPVTACLGTAPPLPPFPRHPPAPPATMAAGCSLRAASWARMTAACRGSCSSAHAAPVPHPRHVGACDKHFAPSLHAAPSRTGVAGC